MGHLASPGVSIIVPAYFACAGILLFLGLTAAIVAVRRGYLTVFGTFAAMALSASLMGFATAAYYQSGSLAEGLKALRWQGHGEALFVGSLLAFVVGFTEVRQRGVWVVAIAAATALTLSLHVEFPSYARFALAQSAGWILFSWGELLFHIQGKPGAWMWVLHAAGLVVLAWAAWRVLVLLEWGERRSATFLAVSVGVLAAAFLHGALVDFGIVRSFYALVPAAVLVSALLGLRLIELLEGFRQPARTDAEVRRDQENWKEATGQHRIYPFSDPLTGLPNRMFVFDHLTGLIERGPPQSHGAVLLCALAHYEASDRMLTQAFADELMREVTVRLTNAAHGRALVARTSGESFTTVLEGYAEDEDAAAEAIQALANEMTHALSRPLRVGDYALTVVARFGMATFETRVSSPTEVLNRAERALEGAKALRHGRRQALLRGREPRAPAP